MRKYIYILAGVCLLALSTAAFGIVKDNGTSNCSLSSGITCFHIFASTATTTTADSNVYSVKHCESMSYSCDGDGNADFLIYEFRDSEGSDGNVWTDDMDNDGDVDAADEAITFNCAAGRRGLRSVSVGKPYQKIDVQTVPGAGSAYVTIRCNGS